MASVRLLSMEAARVNVTGTDSRRLGASARCRVCVCEDFWLGYMGRNFDNVGGGSLKKRDVVCMEMVAL